MENIDELVELLSKTTNREKMRSLLKELHTKAELDELAKRYFIMKELSRGVPQRKIAQEMEVSLCNITRGSKVLKDEESQFRSHFTEMFDETHI